MAEMLFINPRRAKRRKNPRRRRKNSRKMPAALKAYWAGKRRKNPRRRRKNPRHHRRHHNPRHHHRRRNPRSGGLTGQIQETLVPAAIGAAGGLAINVVFAKVSSYLPTAVQTGIGALVIQLAAAIGLAIGGRRFLGASRAEAAAVGAATVLVYGQVKSYLIANVPSLGLSGYSDLHAYTRPAMGAYMGAGRRQLGFYSAAPMVKGGTPVAAGVTGATGLGAYMRVAQPAVAAPANLHGLAGYDTSDGM